MYTTYTAMKASLTVTLNAMKAKRLSIREFRDIFNFNVERLGLNEENLTFAQHETLTKIIGQIETLGRKQFGVETPGDFDFRCDDCAIQNDKLIFRCDKEQTTETSGLTINLTDVLGKDFIDNLKF